MRRNVQPPRSVFAPIADEKITRDLVRERATLRIEAVAVGLRRRLVRECFKGRHQRSDLRVIESQQRRYRVLLNRVAITRHSRSPASLDPRAEFLLGDDTLAREHPIEPSGHIRCARCIARQFAGAEAARKHRALLIAQAVHFFE